MSYYEDDLSEAKSRVKETLRRATVVAAEEMPVELSSQGRLTHVVHERMDTRLRSVNSYILDLAPHGRSGKHRHMGEELIYVMRGSGYDLHWDVWPDIRDRYTWKADRIPKRFEWGESDMIYIPPNTIHQHFNTSAKNARLISFYSRLYRFLGFHDLEQVEAATP